MNIIFSDTLVVFQTVKPRMHTCTLFDVLCLGLQANYMDV